MAQPDDGSPTPECEVRADPPRGGNGAQPGQAPTSSSSKFVQNAGPSDQRGCPGVPKSEPAGQSIAGYERAYFCELLAQYDTHLRPRADRKVNDEVDEL